ncbi:MAG: transketolase C-terminal domain-containing protein [Chlamydiota bacterium]
MRKTFIDYLTEQALKREDIWLLTADLGYSFVEKFADACPDRFINMGVAEQNMVGVAAGLAMMGKKVFIYSIVNFITFRCLEQIRQDICYHGLDVTVVGVGAGFAYGDAGYSHHALEDIAIMRVLPSISIFSPADKGEVEDVMQWLCSYKGPAYLRLGKASERLYEKKAINQLMNPIEVQSGVDLVLLSTGAALSMCLKVAQQLPEYSVGVWSFPCIYPLNDKFVKSIVNQANYVISVEEHGEGGFATLLLECFYREKLHVAFDAMYYAKASIKQAGSTEELGARSGVSIEKIYHRAIEKLGLLKNN